jgi:hypothetical protein
MHPPYFEPQARPRSGIQRMQNANAVDKNGCICSPSKVGGEGSVRVGAPHASVSTRSAHQWGRKHVVKITNQQPSFFRWFLRILTSNLESRRPTSSLTRMKVSLSRPSRAALQHPWPTCQQFGPSAWYSTFIFLSITWSLRAFFVCSKVPSPTDRQKGRYQLHHALLEMLDDNKSYAAAVSRG